MNKRSIILGFLIFLGMGLVFIGGIGLPRAHADATVGNLIIKVIVANTASTNFKPEDFTVNVSASNASKTGFPGSDNGTWVTVDPGAYSITQSVANPGDFSTTLSAECSGTVAASSTANCTITNTVTIPLPATCANGATLSLSEAKAHVASGKIKLETIVPNSGANTLSGSITNGSGCALPASMAAFTIDDPSDPNFNIQTLFDSTHGITVAASSTQSFSVRMPVCNFQSDYFYGDNAPSPKGDRQNPSPYFLDAGFIVNRAAAGGFGCASASPALPPPATTTPTTTPVVTPPPVVVSSGSSASSPAPTPSVLGAASHHHPVILANVLTTTTTTVSNPPAGSVLGASAVSLPITGRTEETLLYFNALLATCFVSLFVYNNIKRRKRGVTNTK